MYPAERLESLIADLPHWKKKPADSVWSQAAAKEYNSESSNTCLPLVSVASLSDPPVQLDKPAAKCVYLHSRDKVKKVGRQLSAVHLNFICVFHEHQYIYIIAYLSFVVFEALFKWQILFTSWSNQPVFTFVVDPYSSWDFLPTWNFMSTIVCYYQLWTLEGRHDPSLGGLGK